MNEILKVNRQVVDLEEFLKSHQSREVDEFVKNTIISELRDKDRSEIDFGKLSNLFGQICDQDLNGVLTSETQNALCELAKYHTGVDEEWLVPLKEILEMVA